MAAPIAVNPNTQGRQIWSARKAPDINSLLLMNTDLNNTVLVGSDLTSLVVPILPNGSLSVDPSENWYAVWSVAGGSPLVILPNGQNNFLGLTQALGSLVLPSVHSPNYLAGLLGWTINKDGSAEFNNLTVRGNIVFPNGWLSNGDGTYTNQPGLFLYDGTPAAGNLVYSATNNNGGGHDKFNNNFLPNVTEYNNGAFVAFNTIAGAMQWFTMTAQPNAVFTGRLALAADTGSLARVLIFGDDANVFTSNLGLDSNGILKFQAGVDSNTYRLGVSDVHLSNNAAAITLASFTAILSQNIAAGVNYRFTAKVFFQGNAAGGNAVLSMGHGGTATNTLCGARAMFGPSAGGQGGLTFITHAATFPGDQQDPIALTNGGLGVWEIDGYFNCTGSGSVIISGAQVGGGNWTPLSGSFFDIWPVS